MKVRLAIVVATFVFLAAMTAPVACVRTVRWQYRAVEVCLRWLPVKVVRIDAFSAGTPAVSGIAIHARVGNATHRSILTSRQWTHSRQEDSE